MTYDEAKAKIPVHAIFRHFKGNLYEVLAIAKNTENEEPVVIYQDINKRGIIWARPASMWFDEINEGTKRFERLNKKSRNYEEAKHDYELHN